MIKDGGSKLKKLPKLTSGAWRLIKKDKAWNARAANSLTDKGSYGGFKAKTN
jgi:hypothetical protein